MIEVEGAVDPVVQVVDEASGEVVYTLRIRGTSFRPWVFGTGTYTIHIGEGPARKTYRSVRAHGLDDDDGTDTLHVVFRRG